MKMQHKKNIHINELNNTKNNPVDQQMNPSVTEVIKAKSFTKATMINDWRSYHQENILFLKRLIKNPKALGAIAPSSKSLSRKIVEQVNPEDHSYLLEVGAGTGRFTELLLASGVQTDKLIVIELDLELCQFLRAKFPHITVIQGDATQLINLLPPETVKNIGTVISGIPLVNLTKDEQQKLFAAFKDVLEPQGRVLQFTYAPISPISSQKFGVIAKRVGNVFFNIPPATVWSYTFKSEHALRRKRRSINVYIRAAQLKAHTKIKSIREHPLINKK